ncbi:MAG TPA: hypothetical protein VGL80_28740, partial [Pseudonocardiaceae bacterium]
AQQAPTPTNDLASAMTTKSPVPGSDLVPVDPDPAALAGVRMVLVIEAVLLTALGLWGLIAALTQQGNGPSGAPVLWFHFTWQHAIVLLATVVLALVGTLSHSWALRATALQAVGYGVMFIVGAGAVNWFADPANDWLHAFLAILGLGLLMWTAARAFGDRSWVRKSDLDS